MTHYIEISDADLPVLSGIATQALQLINNPNVTNQKLEDLIKQDPALATRLLHIANSPFYATPMAVKTIADAVRRLGLRQLRNVVVTAAAGELFDDKNSIVQALWDHSIAMGMATQTLVEELKLAKAEEAFIAGMLHDIGKVIIYRQQPEAYADVIERAHHDSRPLHELEDETFEFFNHMTVGGLAIRKWRLSDTISEAARFHHDLFESVPPNMVNPTVVCAVAVADVIINQMEKGAAGETLSVNLANAACRTQLGCSLERLGQIRSKIAEQLQKSFLLPAA